MFKRALEKCLADGKITWSVSLWLISLGVILLTLTPLFSAKLLAQSGGGCNGDQPCPSGQNCCSNACCTGICCSAEEDCCAVGQLCCGGDAGSCYSPSDYCCCSGELIPKQ